MLMPRLDKNRFLVRQYAGAAERVIMQITTGFAVAVALFTFEHLRSRNGHAPPQTLALVRAAAAAA
jgi:hypothetical protein